MEVFKEYINMWKNYANFSDRTNTRGYWMAFLWNFAAALVLGVIVSIVKPLAFLTTLYSLAALVPGLALTVRRLRDTGKEWTYILFGLIPLVGAIPLIIQLCKPSVEDDGIPVV